MTFWSSKDLKKGYFETLNSKIILDKILEKYVEFMGGVWNVVEVRAQGWTFY
jgi:hypothetical protein